MAPTPASTPSILWNSARMAGSSGDKDTLAASSTCSPIGVRSMASSSTRPTPSTVASTASTPRPTPMPGARTRRTSWPRRSRTSSTATATANPGLRYVVMVGGDDVVPFFRYPDRRLLGPESDYVPPVADDSRLAGQPAPRLRAEPGRVRRRDADLAGREHVPGPGPRRRPAGRDRRRDRRRCSTRTSARELASSTPSIVAGDRLRLPRRRRRRGPSASSQRRHRATHAPTRLHHARTAGRRQIPRSVDARPAARPAARAAATTSIFLAGHFSANSALAADYDTTVLTTELAASSDRLHELDRVQRGLPLRLQHRRRRRRSRASRCRSTGRRRSPRRARR